MIPKVQGSPEWLEWRRSRIGASDCSVCCGLNPYKNMVDLYHEKINRLDPVSTAAMTRGQMLESEAKKVYKDIYGIELFSDVIVHPSIPYLFASLDGISLDRKHLVEIKCPGKKNHLAFQNKIPEFYRCQLQMQMMCEPIDHGYFFSYYPRLSPVRHRLEFDSSLEAKILEATEYFYQCLVTQTEPEPKRYFIVPEIKRLIEDYIYWKQKKHQAEENLKLLKEQLILNGHDITYKNFRMTKYTKLGGIDYTAIPELTFVDLEKYRKPSTEGWLITTKE